MGIKCANHVGGIQLLVLRGKMRVMLAQDAKKRWYYLLQRQTPMLLILRLMNKIVVFTPFNIYILLPLIYPQLNNINIQQQLIYSLCFYLYKTYN